MDQTRMRRLLRPVSGLAGSLRIVEANLHDRTHADAIVQLLTSYAREPMGMSDDLPPDVRARVIPGLRAHPTSLVYLAFFGREAVAIAVCFRSFSTFSATPVLNVHDLAVRPGFRGRRIAHELLRHVEDRARAFGCSKLTLEMREDNDSARRLYRRAGFVGDEPTETRPRTLFLEKPLVAPPRLAVSRQIPER
jgi:GNAT superfamily N-acetyltransferase